MHTVFSIVYYLNSRFSILISGPLPPTPHPHLPHPPPHTHTHFHSPIESSIGRSRTAMSFSCAKRYNYNKKPKQYYIVSNSKTTLQRYIIAARPLDAKLATTASQFHRKEIRSKPRLHTYSRTCLHGPGRLFQSRLHWWYRNVLRCSSGTEVPC